MTETAAAPLVVDGAPDRSDDVPVRARWWPGWLLPVVLVGVLAPLAVAVIAQRGDGWHPVYDLAMTELRVRDVGGPHTPLIGLQGRIGPTGSHPGPISFYLLAPVYRLLGSSAFALQAATGVFHGAAAVTALLVVRRRREGWALLGVGLVLLLLMQGYGLGSLTEPWNPLLPMLWFVAFLVAAWAVVDGDLPMLLPAVAAASICAQTHVPYLAMTLGLGGLVTLAAATHAWRRWRDDRVPDWRWLAAAAALGLVLWAPPLIDEVINEPGNLTQIVDHLGTPTEEPIGIRAASDLVVEHLDAWRLVVEQVSNPGAFTRLVGSTSPSRTVGVLSAGVRAAWVAAAVLLRSRRLLALHAVVGAAAALAVVAISRIYGVPWAYLMYWAHGIGALMLLSIVATAAVLLARWRPELRRPQGAMAGGVVGLVLLAALSARLLQIAPDATTDTPEQTQQLGRLIPDTVAALEAGEGAASGPDGRSTVLWDDVTHGGSVGVGMVNELVRRGFDVGVDEPFRIMIGKQRVRDDDEATARVLYASGPSIERWAAEPGAVQVAYDDPRTPAERAAFADARDAAIAELRRMGRDDLIEEVDVNLFGLALNAGLEGPVRNHLAAMLEIGLPAAVFVLPAAS